MKKLNIMNSSMALNKNLYNVLECELQILYQKNIRDDKEPKTEEGLASPEGASHGAVSPERLTGLQNAPHVTLKDKNKTIPKKDPGRVAAGKNLAECNRTVREEKKEKGGLKQSEDPGLEEASPEGVGTTDPGVGLQPEQSSFSLSHILSVASVYR